MKRTIQSCICIYLFFLIFFFCIKKNKWRLQTIKVPESLFWGTHFSKSLTVATSLGILRAKLHIKLKWQICTFVLHGLAWYCCLFVYLCLMRCCIYFCCMIFCCLYCLLKYFPNCHSVWHPNNIYAPLFNNLWW